MLILNTFFFTIMFAGATLIVMTMWLGLNSNAFFDKTHPRYYKATIGNPLNGMFDDALLTEKGLRWRGLIGKVQVVIWIGFLVVWLIESVFAS